MAKIKKLIKKEVREDIIDVSHIKGLEAIEISARKFTQFDLDFTNSDVIIPEFEDIKDAIVKVNIRIKQEDVHKININDMEDEIKKHCYILKPIVASIQKHQKVRDKNLTSELSPLEAIKVWVEGRNYKDKELILSMSEEIIRQEGF